MGFGCSMRLIFLELSKFLEHVLFDDYILLITGPTFTKLAWMVHHIILMPSTGLNAKSEPKVSDA